MSLMKAFNEWSHRRYHPRKVRCKRKIPPYVEATGDPLAPPKGLWTNWREKWSWAVMSVRITDPDTPQWYRPGYSYDSGGSFRVTIRTTDTPHIAFRVGLDPVIFSVFAANDLLIDAELRLEGQGLTWSQVVAKCEGEENVTFV